MTNDSGKRERPREFKFKCYPEEMGFCILWDGDFGLPTPQTEQYHVIEYRAFEQLRAELESERELAKNTIVSLANEVESFRFERDQLRSQLAVSREAFAVAREALVGIEVCNKRGEQSITDQGKYWYEQECLSRDIAWKGLIQMAALEKGMK